MVVGLLVVAVGSGGCSAREPETPPAPRGVILVSIDTLRPDHLGCYGYDRPSSPFLDRLASRGVLFLDAVSSAPWTLPAHASMLTGLSSSGHGAVDARSAMSASVTTAAELFRESGFATGGVVASWFVSRNYGFDRGFDWFEDFEATKSRRREVRAGTVVAAAAEWLREHRDERIFLFVHLYDPHYDYDPPSPYREAFDTGYRGPRPRYRNYRYYESHPLSPARLEQEVALYDGEILYVDSQIERLWGVVENLGRASSTLLVVTSDHGEEFFERGSWGHAHTLFDELVRVPLIVTGPGVAPGRRVGDQVRLVDLVPTLVESVGLGSPAGIEGRSLRPFLSSHGEIGPADSRPALLESYRYDTRLLALRRQGWKLISDLGTNQERLFFLEADPGEERDLAATRPEQLAAMRAGMRTTLLPAIPDRWSARWAPDNTEAVTGEVSTDGRFIDTTVRGEGARDADADRQRVSFALSPGAALELVVLPVDASLTFRLIPGRAGPAVPILAGDSPPSVPGEPVTISGRGRQWSREPAPGQGRLQVWLSRKRQIPDEVELDEETRKALESLGYIM